MEEEKIEQRSAQNKGPVYSQATLEYMLKNAKAAKRRGVVIGFVISMAVTLVVTMLYLGVNAYTRIRNGSVLTGLIGNVSSSIVDKQTLEKINTIYGLMRTQYLDEIDKDAIQEGFYTGMVDALGDKYSQYFTKEEYAVMMEDVSGTFEGIGAYFQQDPDTKIMTVARPIKNSPADKAGILAEDILYMVDGEDVTGQELEVVVSKIKGPAGTTVHLSFYRADQIEPVEFDVVRAEIDAESVESEMIDDNIGHITILEFADATPAQFNEQLKELQDQGMTSMVLDLRGNPGGYVDASVEVAGAILDGSKTVVTVKNKAGKVYAYEDNDEQSLDMPIVVLVDAGSASAAEILTGALKDYEVATIMGTTTFGKGIVQNVMPLGDGSGLKVTTAKYYSPNGDNIHEIGIEPDIEVKWDYQAYKKDKTDNQLDAAVDYLKKNK